MKKWEKLKTANCPKRRDASAAAGLGCRGGLAAEALQLRVFAPLLFISAPQVPLIPTGEAFWPSGAAWGQPASGPEIGFGAIRLFSARGSGVSPGKS
jgi:hypothetical protein